LRKAYGIGICSVEEIGTIPNTGEKLPPQNANGNGDDSGSKVRDRLCQIIRQHQLDPELVKAYAVDFCGTKTLRDATREQVENFVLQVADWADKDRNALLISPCRIRWVAAFHRRRCGATTLRNSLEVIILVFFQNLGKWRWLPVTK
jgi:hypothetical protein